MDYNAEFDKWAETDNIFIPKDTTKEDSIKIINNHKQAWNACATLMSDKVEELEKEKKGYGEVLNRYSDKFSEFRNTIKQLQQRLDEAAEIIKESYRIVSMCRPMPPEILNKAQNILEKGLFLSTVEPTNYGELVNLKGTMKEQVRVETTTTNNTVEPKQEKSCGKKNICKNFGLGCKQLDYAECSYYEPKTGGIE